MIPLLPVSPGLDPDAWRMLLAARYFADHHVYIASRLPGYPLPELTFALLVGFPIWVCVGLTLLISLAGFFFFFKIIETVQIKDRMLVTLAFAFTPVVLINCFTTMDYMWALTFALGSLYATLRRRLIMSGLLLGFGVACRITTVLMVIPLMFLILQGEDNRKVKMRQSVLLLLLAALPSMLFYAPVVATYGIGFLKHANPGAVHIASLAKLLTIDTVGIIGTVGIVIAFVLYIGSKKVVNESTIPRHRQWTILCWMVVVPYLFLFFMLPLEAGYLIPVIPFLLLFARLHLNRMTFRVLAVGLIVSPFLLSIDATDRPWSSTPSFCSTTFAVSGRELTADLLHGPLVLDFYKRQAQVEYAESVLGWANGRIDSAVLVAGVWMPPLTYLAGELPGKKAEEQFSLGKVKVLGLVDNEVATSIRRSGIGLYYIPGQNLYDKSVYGIDVEQIGGKELTLEKLPKPFR